MTEQLAEVFARKRALLELEESLLRQARTLYNLGFHPPTDNAGGVSAAQMAAVEERIQKAESFAKASGNVSTFIKKQLEKLEEREKRDGKKASWLKPPRAAGGGASLGKTLQAWIAEERYLKKTSDVGKLDHLAALRRFWSYFHGLYRYQKACNQGMAFPPTLRGCDEEATG